MMRLGSHRRIILAADILLWLLALTGVAMTTEPQIVVVTEPGINAYGDALRGLEGGLKSLPRVVNASDATAVKAALAGAPPLVVALGSDALTALTAAHTEAPVLLTMVLEEAVRGARVHLAGSVHLDPTVAQVLDEVAALFPGKSRLGVIRNPAKGAWIDAAGLAHARQQGFTVSVADCASAEELLRVFLAMRGKADFVVALPDSTLYNSATIKPLILASLQNRLPLIGFSAAFVRSGATLGVYADFEDIGQQAAQAAQRILSGQAGSSIDEGPRKHIAAVNQRVLRLLGMDCKPRGDVVVYK